MQNPLNLMELPQIERWLSYTAVRQLAHTHTIRQSEVPIEHFVSLPLPTRRFGLPAYGCYAAPSSRNVPSADNAAPLWITQQRPDRWWLFSARSEHLLHYTLCQVEEFTDHALSPSITFTEDRPLTVIRQLLVLFDQRMELVIKGFFQEELVDATIRMALLDTLNQITQPAQRPVYEALAPDFFAFLTT